ncbi:hypothetical protein PIB30_092644 [Stylosanthes scabra]|uniref:Uncharacterized protein n=1 Tax=Stylosanthes scabra TaxID=79078 RepID=A0ABU6TX90_9FABA|nr:hypothetical protein [Stylosanthes scabra]
MPKGTKNTNERESSLHEKTQEKEGVAEMRESRKEPLEPPSLLKHASGNSGGKGMMEREKETPPLNAWTSKKHVAAGTQEGGTRFTYIKSPEVDRTTWKKLEKWVVTRKLGQKP